MRDMKQTTHIPEGGRGSREPSVEEVFRMSQHVTNNSLYGFARITKAAAALWDCPQVNIPVATFRSGVRYPAENPLPKGLVPIAEAAEQLRRTGTELARGLRGEFSPADRSALIHAVQLFRDGIRGCDQIFKAPLDDLGARLVARTEQAFNYVRSRPTSVIGLYWHEVINQLLEESALLTFAAAQREKGVKAGTNPHGTFLEPIDLVAQQSTVDREREVRKLILSRARAACERFSDYAREWTSTDTVSLDQVRATREAFNAFHRLVTGQRGFDGSAGAPGSAGLVDHHQVLFDAHAALYASGVNRCPSDPSVKRVVAAVCTVCSRELAWAEWLVPFGVTYQRGSEEALAARLEGFADKEPPRISRFAWERFPRMLKHYQRGHGDDPLTRPELRALADWERFFAWTEQRHAERSQRFLPAGQSLAVGQYGGESGVAPHPSRLTEYETFQKQFVIDLQDPSPKIGLGGSFPRDYLNQLFTNNRLLATEMRQDGRLIGVYFQAPNSERLNGLAKVLSDALPDASRDYFDRTARAFSLLIAGPSDLSVARQFGRLTPTTLQEDGEAAIRHENGLRPVILLSVCRSKPANLAIESHFRNGWQLLDTYYTTDTGIEYVVLIRRLAPASRYLPRGRLDEARLPKVAAAHGIEWQDVVAEEDRQRRVAEERAAAQRDRFSAQPDKEHRWYADPRHLHKRLFFSPLSFESGIRCWQAYSADHIVNELLRLAVHNGPVERPSTALERKLVGSRAGDLFHRLFPERYERAARDRFLLITADRCDALAETAGRRCASPGMAWMEADWLIQKPREVARCLREAAAAPYESSPRKTEEGGRSH